MAEIVWIEDTCDPGLEELAPGYCTASKLRRRGRCATMGRGSHSQAWQTERYFGR